MKIMNVFTTFLDTMVAGFVIYLLLFGSVKCGALLGTTTCILTFPTILK